MNSKVVKNPSILILSFISIMKAEITIKKAWTDTAKDAYSEMIWPSPQFRKKRNQLYL